MRNSVYGAFVRQRACDLFAWRIYMVTCVMARVARLRSTCSEVRDDLGDGLCDGVHKTACVVTCMDKRV